MSTPTVLPAAALSQLAPAITPYAARYGWPALARAGLYLTPVPLALAAGDWLARVPWPVPAGVAAAGWCALSGLRYLGRVTAGRPGSGPAAATRLVVAGFGGLAVAWSVLLALAPAELAGPDRAAAYAVSLPLLGLLAGITAALATGTEPALLRWCVPALLVAGAAIAGWLPVPAGPALLAATGLAAARGLAPALRRPGARHPLAPDPLGNGELLRAAGYAAVGLSQVAAVGLIWWAARPAGPPAAAPGGLPPALVPLLVAVPLIELWVGWHLARTAAGLARHDDRGRYQRYLRRLGWATLAALLPPLVAGVGLAGTAYRLPYRLSTHPDAAALILALAAGVLLTGVIAVGWLLAARDRPGLAAAVTAGPVVGAGLGAVVGELARAGGLASAGPVPVPGLPATVVALATAYPAALVLAAYLLVDPRSRR